MQKAPVLKSSGLAPIDDEAVHVFGRNLEDRVVAREGEESKSDPIVVEPKDDDVESIKKRKVEPITGEEGEETVFQGDFKLFVWDLSTSNWTEKGRGQLKLNDQLHSNGSKSRLIMRIGGTYRIVLNVAIQHSVFKVIAKTKTSIRFTDSQNVWAASGSNARELGQLIEERLRLVAAIEKREESCEESASKKSNVEKKNENSDTSTEESASERLLEVGKDATEATDQDGSGGSHDPVEGEQPRDIGQNDSEQEEREKEDPSTSEGLDEEERKAEKSRTPENTDKSGSQPVEGKTEEKGEATEQNEGVVEGESKRLKLSSI